MEGVAQHVVGGLGTDTDDAGESGAQPSCFGSPQRG